MKNFVTEKEWLKEFESFTNESSDVHAPQSISDLLLNFIYKEMHPPAQMVFLKLLGLHAIVGTLSLTICDQFGIRLFDTGFSLSDYFMKFGHSVCMTLCGCLFISLTLVLGHFFLRPEEVSVLKKNIFAQVPALAAISLGVFMILVTEIVLKIALLWLLGATAGGFLTSKFLNRKIRA